MNSPTNNTRRFATFALLIAGLAAPTFAAEIEGTAVEGTPYTRIADVIYARKHGTALTMDVIVPPKQNGAAVVWVASSGFHSHHSMIEGPRFAKNMSVLLDRGYTIFAVVHGSVPKFTVPEYYSDMRRAIRFIRHHAKRYGVDGQRIGISGASAGGVISLMMGAAAVDGNPEARDPVDRHSSAIQAVGCFYPASDLLHFNENGETVIPVATRCGHGESYNFRNFDPKTRLYVPVTDEERILELLAEYSPVTHASAGDPPMLIVHGDEDQLVPIGQASKMIDRLTAVDVQAKLFIAKGKGHGWGDMWTNEMRQIADWFDKHLAEE